MITEKAYQDVASELGLDVAIIKAVAQIESRGKGFIGNEPKILFERHVFSRLTGGRYDAQYPDISNPIVGGYGAESQQHNRLQKAASLDREAALKSASWGKFQIMGFNYAPAGFKTLQDFINAMYKSEDEHLKAFATFIQSEGLVPVLRALNWKEFARRYNGPAYAKQNYDGKLASAYQKFKGE